MIAALVGAVAGLAPVLFVLRMKASRSQQTLKLKLEREIQTLTDKQATHLEKKRQQLASRHELEKERLSVDLETMAERKSQFDVRYHEVDLIHTGLDKLQKRNKEKQSALAKVRQNIRLKEEELETCLTQQRSGALDLVGETEEQLKQGLLEVLESEVVHERQRWMRRILEEVEHDQNDRAEDFIDLLINRLQLKPTVKQQENRINLSPKEFDKKHLVTDSPVIETVKELCKVDVLFNEEGDQLTVSAYDGVAREVAMRLLDKIRRDRKADVEWVKEQYPSVVKRLEREMTRQAGDLMRRLSLGKTPVEVVRLQGRIRYRTSFGQNVLDHELEVGFLTGMLSQEIGGHDMRIGRRCGFYHDIGKALDVVQEGSHPELGGDYLAKYEEQEDAVKAAYNHHNPYNPNELYTAFTTACDAISASRPGARRESIDSYIERLESLEKLAREPEGVQSVAVMQAGRQVQVNVHPDKVDDDGLAAIAESISKRIEEELVYPGEIEVNVVRETLIKVEAH